MKCKLLVLVTIILLISGCHATAPSRPPDPRPRVDALLNGTGYVSYDASVAAVNNAVTDLLWRGQYHRLDALAAALRKSESQDGLLCPSLARFYDASGGRTEYTSLKWLVNRWVQADPHSLPARLMAVQQLFYGYQSVVSIRNQRLNALAFQRFKRRVETALDRLSTFPGAKQSPYFWFMCLRLDTMMNQSPKVTDEHLQHILKLDPRFYEAYVFRVNLGPKQLTRWIPKAAAIARHYGPKAYAACLVLLRELGHMRFTQLSACDWKTAKRGFDGLLKRYPHDGALVNWYARLAKTVGDKATARRLLHRIGWEWSAHVWSTAARFEAARRWAGVTSIAPHPDLAVLPAGPERRFQVGSAIFSMQARELVTEGRFEELELAAARLRKSKARNAVGTPLLNLLYSVPDNGPALKKFLKACHEWRRQFPDSETARVMTATAWWRYAWLARGSGFASSVTPRGGALFLQRLAKAEKQLLSIPGHRRDPQGYALEIAVGMGLGWNRASVEADYAAAMKLDPDYAPAAQAMATYLLPRWGGSRGELEDFIARGLKKNPRLLYDILLGWNRPVLKLLPWKLVRRGLAGQGKTTRQQQIIDTWLAYSAMMNGHPAVAARYLKSIHGPRHSGLWTGNSIAMARAGKNPFATTAPPEVVQAGLYDADGKHVASADGAPYDPSARLGFELRWPGRAAAATYWLELQPPASAKDHATQTKMIAVSSPWRGPTVQLYDWPLELEPCVPGWWTLSLWGNSAAAVARATVLMAPPVDHQPSARITFAGYCHKSDIFGVVLPQTPAHKVLVGPGDIFGMALTYYNLPHRPLAARLVWRYRVLNGKRRTQHNDYKIDLHHCPPTFTYWTFADSDHLAPGKMTMQAYIGSRCVASQTFQVSIKPHHGG